MKSVVPNRRFSRFQNVQTKGRSSMNIFALDCNSLDWLIVALPLARAQLDRTALIRPVICVGIICTKVTRQPAVRQNRRQSQVRQSKKGEFERRKPRVRVDPASTGLLDRVRRLVSHLQLVVDLSLSILPCKLSLSRMGGLLSGLRTYRGELHANLALERLAPRSKRSERRQEISKEAK